MSGPSSTMLAVTAPKFTVPSGYELATTSVPAITEPDDVLVKVHAASVNPVDVKLASGVFKVLLSEKFPLKIGFDCAGIVTAVGSAVTKFKVGDEVWSRLPEISKGSRAEYIKCSEEQLSLKPSNLSFDEAASLPLAALTTWQALKKYDGSLEGKTVFIPAGLGGTGAFACQLAKNVFHASKVITTVSTSKIPLVPKLLGENVVDQIIDYTTTSPLTAIPQQSVDFILDTVSSAIPTLLPLMVPNTGTIISISTTPSSAQMQAASFFRRPSRPRVPWYAGLALDTMDRMRKWRAGRYGIRYEYMFLDAKGEELDGLRGLVEEGKLRAVIGETVALTEIERVREVCGRVYEGKGGVGKVVIKVR